MLLLKVIAFFSYRKHAGLETQMQKIAQYEGSRTAELHRFGATPTTSGGQRGTNSEPQSASEVHGNIFKAHYYDQNSTGTTLTH